MSIWKNEEGHILVSDEGHIFTCDECPCAEDGCADLYPSTLNVSMFATLDPEDGTWTGTITNNAPSNCDSIPTNECIYAGLVNNPTPPFGGDEWVTLLDQIAVPRVILRIYHDSPPTCGFHCERIVLATHNPFGVYDCGAFTVTIS